MIDPPDDSPTTAIRAWRPVPDLDVLVMSGPTTQYSFDPIDEYVLGRVTEAPLHIRRGKERHVVAPGQAVAWDPEHAHAGTGLDGRPWWAELVMVSADAMAMLLERDVPSASGGVYGANSRFASAFTTLSRGTEIGDRLAVESALVTLAHLWADADDEPYAAVRTGSTCRWDSRVRTVQDLMFDDLAAPTTLARLAETVDLSKYQLLRLFEREVGATPHALRRRMRLRRAQALIEAGQPLSEVATAVGFYDQSHLHRHFVCYLGMTPGLYRLATAGSVP